MARVLISNLHNASGFIFCRMVDADSGAPLEGNATLDFCISACHRDGDEIGNAHEVLTWLHYNATLVPHR
jgi:hypothetical protein